jgi:hypothetical protein
MIVAEGEVWERPARISSMIPASGGNAFEIAATMFVRACGSLTTRPAIPLARSASGIRAKTAL